MHITFKFLVLATVWTATTSAVGAADLICGGDTHLTCPSDQFCKTSGSGPLGEIEHLGLCSPRPTACAAVYIPVCGENGQTYSNDCAAHSVGVNIAAQGACDVQPEKADATPNLATAPEPSLENAPQAD